jgi:hypothetical protein
MIDKASYSVECDSVMQIYDRFRSSIDSAKVSDSPIEVKLFLKRGFIINDTYSVSIVTNSIRVATIATYRMDNGQRDFRTLEVYVGQDVQFDPIYKLFGYNIVTTGNILRNKEYSMYLTITAYKDDAGEVTGSVFIDAVEEISEQRKVNPEVYSILNEYPFLIGFLGIKKTNIPVVMDSEITMSILSFMKTIFWKPNQSFTIKVSSANPKIPSIEIPITLFNDKLFILTPETNSDVMEITRADTIKVAGFVFENKAHITPVIIRNISDYFDTQGITRYATFITKKLAEPLKDYIKILCESEPVTVSDLESHGFSMDKINTYLYMSGALIKYGYTPSIQVLKYLNDLIVDPEVLVSVTKKDIGETVLYPLLVGIAFYMIKLDEKTNEMTGNIRTDLISMIGSDNAVEMIKLKEKISEIYSLHKITVNDMMHVVINERLQLNDEIDEKSGKEIIYLNDNFKREILEVL